MGLNKFRVGGIVPASDVDRAVKFYTETLGLEKESGGDDTGTVLSSADGTSIAIYQTPSAGKAEHTIVGWTVDDLPTTVADLRAKGVVFEEYDFPGLKTVDSVATNPSGSAAWFKDSEGNILGIFAPAGQN